MGKASRSEAVTVPGKRPSVSEEPAARPADQSVADARHAELSDPAIRLGDFDPFYRLRLIGSCEQLRPNACPVLTQVVPGVADGHPIDAGTAPVLANAFPRSYRPYPGSTARALAGIRDPSGERSFASTHPGGGVAPIAAAPITLLEPSRSDPLRTFGPAYDSEPPATPRPSRMGLM
jgi:hypothetical protein